MKFTCVKENLEHSLNLVSSLATKQVNLPILNNVLINVKESNVEIVATNLEVAIKTQVRAKVEETGSFTIPAKTLVDYVHLLTSPQVEITKKENELLVSAGSSKTKIKGSSAEDFPVIPDVEEVHSYSINVDEFKKNLSKVIISVAKNEIRPELSGVYFSFFSENYDGLIMAATDSYRLSEVKTKINQGSDKNVNCIVPARVVHEMGRVLQLGKTRDGEENVRFWISDNQIAIRYSNFEMTSRLIDGKYPDYAQIIPKEFKTKAIFPLSVMVNKIKAASLFTTLGVNAVSFDLNVSQNTIGVSSSSAQAGEHSSEIDAILEGEENSILLNHRYVLDGLAHIDSDSIEFGVNGPDAPCVFKAKGSDDFVYIVMPIRK